MRFNSNSNAFIILSFSSSRECLTLFALCCRDTPSSRCARVKIFWICKSKLLLDLERATPPSAVAAELSCLSARGAACEIHSFHQQQQKQISRSGSVMAPRLAYMQSQKCHAKGQIIKAVHAHEASPSKAKSCPKKSRTIIRVCKSAAYMKEPGKITHQYFSDTFWYSKVIFAKGLQKFMTGGQKL